MRVQVGVRLVGIEKGFGWVEVEVEVGVIY